MSTLNMQDAWEMVAHMSPREVLSVMKLSSQFEAAYVIQVAFRTYKRRKKTTFRCVYSGCGETPW